MPAPFISRSDLAVKMGLADDALEDSEKALQAVDAACDWIRDLTGQEFNRSEDDTILMDGTGRDALLLPQLPVESVASVTVAGEEEWMGYSYELHDSGVLMRTWEAFDITVAASSAIWPKGRNNVEVTYTHGYSDDEFPRSVRMLALERAERIYKGSSGVVFETLGQRSVRYGETDLSSSDELIIRRHTYHRQPSRRVMVS
jgi:hypothetical protein